MSAISSPKLARRKAVSGLFTVACGIATAIAIVALLLILGALVTKGMAGMNLDVFTMDTPAAQSRGGLANAIIGSAMLLTIAMVIAIVLGLLSGTWLAEYGGDSRYALVIRFINAVLLSAPSILIGLFVYTFLVAPFHGYSGFAGAVALALIAIPVITRTTEDVLRLQPGALRESAVALGTPMARAIRSILWKAAQAGLVTGGLLAFARISGETAPLLFTTLSNQFRSYDMTRPIANLPSVINNFAGGADEGLQKLAWAGALLITFLVLATIIVARFVIREQRRS